MSATDEEGALAPSTCGCRGERPAVGTACLPGTPYSIAWCVTCLCGAISGDEEVLEQLRRRYDV